MKARHDGAEERNLSQVSQMSTIRLGRNAPLWRRLLMEGMGDLAIRRTVPTADGRFSLFVCPGSQLSVLGPGRKLVDPMHTRFIGRWIEEDSIIWDVGANVGLFAFPAALKAREGAVYCFEPDIQTALRLSRSARLPVNRGLNLRVCASAVSDQDGTFEFLISKFSRSMNKLSGVAEWHDDLYEVRETRLIPTLRVDTLSGRLPDPTVLKIDVEGAEMMVLRGGRETIARARPVMLIEAPRQIWEELTEFLRALDYVILDGQTDDPKPLPEPVWDTVAVPREKFASPA